MNMRTTLMLMAATVAPIYAQQPTDSAAQVYTSLATPAPATTATPAQRAAAYPALALIPANVEALFTLNNIGNTARALGEIVGDAAPDELLTLQSLAIASGAGTVDAINALIPWITKFQLDEDVRLELWSSATADPAKSIITRLVNSYVEATNKAAMANLSNVKLPPVYAVLTAEAGSEGMLESWLNMVVQSMQEDINPDDEDEVRTAYEANGFAGISINLKGSEFVSPGYDYNEETGELTRKELTEDQKAISAELDKRTIYVLLRREGNALQAVVCEDPASIVQPTKPEESVLGCDKLAGADANLSKNPAALFWGDTGVSAANSKMQFATYLGIAKIAEDSFRELATADAANASTWSKAADGTALLVNTMSRICIPTGNRPDFLQVWQEAGKIEIEYTTSAPDGVSYKPGKLALTSQADKPGTIFYTETTMQDCGNMPDCQQILDAVVNVVDGFVATLPAEEQQSAAAQIGMAKAFLPELKSIFGSMQTIGDGMGNSMAITMDSAGSMPAILGGNPGNTAAMPRICFYSGVTDRAKLSEGWDGLIKTSGEIAAKLGQDPSVVNMLPIVPTTMGNTVSYSVAMPWFTPDMVPNLTVSDTAFTVGTSSNYNAEIAAAATGTTPFAGCVCSIRFAPLAKTARGIADELAKIAKEEKAPLSLGVEGEAEVDTDVEDDVIAAATEDEDSEDYIEEDDYEEEDRYIYKAPTPAEERAEQADDIADACEAVARYVDRVDGVVTVKDGTTTTRVSIKLVSPSAL